MVLGAARTDSPLLAAARHACLIDVGEVRGSDAGHSFGQREHANDDQLALSDRHVHFGAIVEASDIRERARDPHPKTVAPLPNRGPRAYLLKVYTYV